ncbi:MAG: hypothetical protein ABWY08_08220 [Comamonas sp.]
MFNSYKSLGAVWSTATSFIAGATDMASSAGATVLNAGYGPLASAYGTLSEKAGDCLHEIDQQMQDLAGWARGDDPYPGHFGVSLQDPAPPDDSFTAQAFLAGVRDWFTGAGTAEIDC